MKILIVSSLFPLPIEAGGKVRLYNVIKNLSRDHSISLLSLISEDELKLIPLMKQYCSIVETVPVRFNENLLSKISSFQDLSKVSYFMKRLMMVLSGHPYDITRWYFPLFHHKFNRMIEKNSFDLIKIELPFAEQYLNHNKLREKGIRTFLAEYEIRSVFFRRKSATEKGLSKLVSYSLYKQMERYLRSVWRRVDTVVAVSEVDKRKILDLEPACNVIVVPNGVDISYFTPRRKRVCTNDILFIGEMRHIQNLDGISYFAEEIFPLILSDIPDATLTIVGSYMSKKVSALGKRKNIEVVGRVEDVRTPLSACDVMIVPVRISGGTRLRILEAMASGVPVVSTSIGSEGLDVSPDENIMIADDKHDFAERTLRLLKDDTLRKNISLKARKFVEKRYSWDKIVADFSEKLNCSAR